MLFWSVVALLVAVPLVVHLRGGGIVPLSLSVSALYGALALAAGLLAAFPQAAVAFYGVLIPSAPATGAGGAVHDTPIVTSSDDATFASFVAFAVIATVFWGLHRWQAP